MMGIDTIFRQNMKWRNEIILTEELGIGPRGARGQKLNPHIKISLIRNIILGQPGIHSILRALYK